jgi:hypothetical protein
LPYVFLHFILFWFLTFIHVSQDTSKEDGEQAGSITRFRFNEETRKTLYNIMKAEVARTTLKNELK